MYVKMLTILVNFQQIIVNLVDNAYDALRSMAPPFDERVIQVKGYVAYIEGSSCLCLEVCDNGIGMPEQVVKKAKEAFFSTKPSTEGTGLGLSIVNEIVTKHKGQMKVESKEGEYTRVKVILPIISE